MNIRKLFTSFAVIALLATTACTSTANRESSGEIVDSTIISTKVRAAIAADDLLSIIPIDVETFKGVVQLSGFVKTAALRNRAEELARGVDGVQSVRNDLVIRAEAQ